MRTLFNRVLVDIAQRDERIWMILADIGYGEIEPFRDAFPDRWNCGVAEQNMTGVACGVAMEGNIAITYSIANFPTLRCLEQIRNHVCYHNANVKIVIIGGGLAYGPLGVSHQATEDIAIMRALPNMVVFCPCDFAEAEAGVHAMIAHDGLFYYRCGYKQEPPVHASQIAFRLGQAIQVRDGSDATIFFTGTIGNQVLPAAEALDRHGLHCRVVSLHTVKPIDRAAIVPEARDLNDLVEYLGLDMVTVPTMIYCIKHTDGDIRKIMDQLVGIGVDALGPLQDVPGMELDKIVDRYPGRITLMGNLNVDLLGRGTVEEVIAATERLLREVAGGQQVDVLRRGTSGCGQHRPGRGHGALQLSLSPCRDGDGAADTRFGDRGLSSRPAPARLPALSGT